MRRERQIAVDGRAKSCERHEHRAAENVIEIALVRLVIQLEQQSCRMTTYAMSLRKEGWIAALSLLRKRERAPFRGLAFGAYSIRICYRPCVLSVTFWHLALGMTVGSRRDRVIYL